MKHIFKMMDGYFKVSNMHFSLIATLSSLKKKKNVILAWAWLAKPKAIVIIYQLFRLCHAFTEITEKKTRKSANHSLQSISIHFKKGLWKQKYIFS